MPIKITQKWRFSRYLLLSLGLLIFHLTANIVWLKLSQNPVDFDPIGHTLITLNSAEYLRTHLLDFRLSEYLRLSPAYPDLVHSVGALLTLIFGVDWKVVAFTGTLFFSISLAGVFFYVREIADNERIAFFAGLFYSLFISIVQYSRAQMLDIPLTAMFFLTLYLWEKFKKQNNSFYLYASAATAAIAQLSKWHAGIFFIIPGISLFLYLRKNGGLFAKENLIKIFLSLGIFLVLTAPWYLVNLKNFIRLGTINYLGEADDPQNLFSLFNLLFYPKLTLIFQTHFVGFVFFLVSIYIVFKNQQGKEYLFLPLMTLIFSYLFFTLLIVNKNIRVLFPVMPFVALVMAEGADRLWKSLYGKLAVVGIAAYMLAAYFILSFGVPIEPNFKYIRKLPLLGWTDLIYLHAYPVDLLYEKHAIPYGKTIEDIVQLAKNSPRKPDKLVIALHQPYFHKDHFILYLYQDKGVEEANRLLGTEISLLDVRQLDAEGKRAADILHEADIVLTAQNEPIQPERVTDRLYEPLIEIQQELLDRNTQRLIPIADLELRREDRLMIFVRRGIL